jgi:hypothetical protein
MMRKARSDNVRAEVSRRKADESELVDGASVLGMHLLVGEEGRSAPVAIRERSRLM